MSVQINIDTQIKGSRSPSWGVDSGAANAYAVTTVAPLGPGLRIGSQIAFIATNANTGASTVAVDGGSPIAIVKNGSTPLSAGDIPLNGIVVVYYDGTNLQCQSCDQGGAASTAGITIDGGASTPTTGSKGYLQIPFAATITGWTLLADASGSAQITVKKSTYAGFPTTSSIVASAPPVLSSAQKNTSSTLTGWTTAITANDVLEFNLDSVTTCQRLTLELQLART